MIYLSLLGEDKNIQHDISDNKNLKSVINKIITHDNITTEDNLKEDKISSSYVIYIVIKRYK